jgi:hypothetical protein
MTRFPRGFRNGRTRRRDLVVIWMLIAVGVVAVLCSAGYVFSENLMTYAACNRPPRTGCSNVGAHGSLGLSFFGGIVVVAIGGVTGLRRHRNGGDGTWFPVVGLAAVAALTAAAIAFLRIVAPL